MPGRPEEFARLEPKRRFFRDIFARDVRVRVPRRDRSSRNDRKAEERLCLPTRSGVPSLATTPRMALSDAPEALAYYTVTQNERTGWTGGLLVLNHTGRPLEFQCTLPVRPSRAHEILYGPTLQEHLIGEVIAPVLFKKCRTPIAMICCDQPESFRVRERIDVPVALAVEAAEAEEGPISIDTVPDTETIPFAKGHLCVLSHQGDRVRALSDRFRDFPDLVEPFDRIREAIREAQIQLARAA